MFRTKSLTNQELQSLFNKKQLREMNNKTNPHYNSLRTLIADKTARYHQHMQRIVNSNCYSSKKKTPQYTRQQKIMSPYKKVQVREFTMVVPQEHSKQVSSQDQQSIRDERAMQITPISTTKSINSNKDCNIQQKNHQQETPFHNISPKLTEYKETNNLLQSQQQLIHLLKQQLHQSKQQQILMKKQNQKNKSAKLAKLQSQNKQLKKRIKQLQQGYKLEKQLRMEEQRIKQEKKLQEQQIKLEQQFRNIEIQERKLKELKEKEMKQGERRIKEQKMKKIQDEERRILKKEQIRKNRLQLNNNLVNVIIQMQQTPMLEMGINTDLLHQNIQQLQDNNIQLTNQIHYYKSQVHGVIQYISDQCQALQSEYKSDQPQTKSNNTQEKQHTLLHKIQKYHMINLTAHNNQVQLFKQVNKQIKKNYEEKITNLVRLLSQAQSEIKVLLGRLREAKDNQVEEYREKIKNQKNLRMSRYKEEENNDNNENNENNCEDIKSKKIGEIINVKVNKSKDIKLGEITNIFAKVLQLNDS